MNETGHNSIAADRLRSIVERIERLEEEKKHLGEDIKDIFKEAKSAGYDVPALRALLKYRAEDAAKRAEREALLETYLSALGEFSETPLGKAALEAL